MTNRVDARGSQRKPSEGQDGTDALERRGVNGIQSAETWMATFSASTKDELSDGAAPFLDLANALATAADPGRKSTTGSDFSDA